MKRLADFHLKQWSREKRRKPLLLRGARQVGKTFSVETLGRTFPNFVEVNFEMTPEAIPIFDRDLDPHRITRDLSLLTGQKIEAGNTLLFLDEIQEAPKALSSLRYFYERFPDLHVIAAGSLLDFTTEQIGMPVGRIESLYLYPVSFFEFLIAKGEKIVAREILEHALDSPMPEVVHRKILALVAEYLAVGGMPEAIKSWLDTGDPRECFRVHHALIDAYRQDFHKYARKHQIKYIELLFDQIPRQLGKRFKYGEVEGNYRKRELAPSLNLLATAGLAHSVTHSAGNGIPLGAEAKPDRFKVLFLDIALSQAILGLDLGQWFVNPDQFLVNKGEIVEAFAGQEILAYSHPKRKSSLYYWERLTRGSLAEVDYLTSMKNCVIPIEVKSGKGSTLRSMHAFLEDRPQSIYGIRLSTQNYSDHSNIHSYPLYSIACLFDDQKDALTALLSD